MLTQRAGFANRGRTCALNTSAPVAGAAITPDNKRLAVVTSSGAYLFLLPNKGLVQGTVEPMLFVACPVTTMEGCAFTPPGLLVTAETGEILLFTNPLFRTRRQTLQNHLLNAGCATAALAQRQFRLCPSVIALSGLGYDRNMNTSTNWNSSTNGSQGIPGNNSGILDRSNSAENGALKN